MEIICKIMGLPVGCKIKQRGNRLSIRQQQTLLDTAQRNEGHYIYIRLHYSHLQLKCLNMAKNSRMLTNRCNILIIL